MKRGKNANGLKSRILGSSLFIWGGVILVVLMIFALGKAAIRKHDIQTEIQGLESEVGKLEDQNIELNGLIQYFQTENFQEREARDKLGLKKPGETVVAIPTSESEDEPAFPEQEQKAQEDVSNPQKWWNYFFKSQI